MRSGRILRLSSPVSGGSQLPSQVISVLFTRFFTSYSSSGSAGLGLSAGYPCSALHQQLQQHKESRNVCVSVWWDFESCELPAGANVFKVAQAITAAVRSSAIRGPIKITAFGDLFKLSKFNQCALSSMGIDFNYVPHDMKTSATLVGWVSKIPLPAHIFLVSSDRVFASALERLRSNEYNILLASETYALDDLSGAATIMWDWCSLVEGKNVAGIHCNIPLRCEYHSFYGLVPLQDPFAAVERTNSLKTEESPASTSNLNSEESAALYKTPLWPDSGYSSSRWFQQGEESQNVGVFVWWDFNDCNLPAGTDGLDVVQAITTAIRISRIVGPIKVTAVGDVSRLSMNNWTELSSLGVNFNHVPRGGEITAKRALGIDLNTWTIENPPPAHIFVISSDRGIASTLHKLRMRNYNILLASKADASCALLSAATIMWHWHALVKGENVTGRHFNQPPDGPWYNYYMVPLQDPFAAVGQSNSVKTKQSRASNSNLNSEESNALSKTPLRIDSGYGPSTPSDLRVGENVTDKSKSPGFFDQTLK